MGFLSITSAFLVTGHMVGGTISRLLRRLILGLYGVGALTMIGATQRTFEVVLNIRDQMRKEMSWHAAYSEPQWILHAGGKKVLEAIQTRLGLSENDTQTSTDILRQFGNMSSPFPGSMV